MMCMHHRLAIEELHGSIVLGRDDRQEELGSLATEGGAGGDIPFQPTVLVAHRADAVHPVDLDLRAADRRRPSRPNPHPRTFGSDRDPALRSAIDDVHLVQEPEVEQVEDVRREHPRIAQSSSDSSIA